MLGVGGSYDRHKPVWSSPARSVELLERTARCGLYLIMPERPRHAETVANQVTLLIVGFLLTSVAGGLLGSFFQGRTWKHQHQVERAEQEYRQAIKIFEEVSGLLDKRLYRMRLVYRAAKCRARGGDADRGDLKTALTAYQDALLIWNDNLNRCQALTHAYFGAGARQQLEALHYEYIAVGQALDRFVQAVATRQDVEVPCPARK
jgi:hypothetical protein